MNSFASQHPAIFVVGFLLWVVLSLLHFCAAIEYAKVHKRSFFEGTLLAVSVLIVWPLFSFGMMCRGYSDFWEKTWGDSRKP